MIFATLILVALSQQGKPPEHNPEAQQWWEKLSTEERSEYRRRHSNWRDMEGARRSKVEERHRAMHDATVEAQKNLSPEELEKFNKLGEIERREYLHSLIRKKNNGAGPGRKPYPPEQGHELRQKKIVAALGEAEKGGWIGPRTATWLKTASDSERVQVLLEVRKWQFLEKADKDGFWKSEEIGKEQQSRLIAMPAEQFFLEISAIIGGKHKMHGSERQKRRPPPPRKSSKEKNR
ncbi:MAG: hypothetical protein ACI84O_001187 [Myxococcota bacterium]|jgi:hypothetical protein